MAHLTASSEVNGCLKNIDYQNPESILSARHCYLTKSNLASRAKHLKSLYSVNVQADNINGVAADIVTPAGGVTKRNKRKALLYIHGSGGFIDHPLMRQMGSIPMAALGHIKVIGVDHRLMPEGTLADSLTDIGAVYQEVIKTYGADNVGVYGCSNGANLSASLMPWLSQNGLPLPGAIALSGEGGDAVVLGDSTYMLSAFNDSGLTEIFMSPEEFMRSSFYFNDFDAKDPIARPFIHPEVLAQFPPTILLAGTRDMTTHRVIDGHRDLLRNGVDAELHLWDGLPHCFQNGMPEIPESRELYGQQLRFFEKHLGR